MKLEKEYMNKTRSWTRKEQSSNKYSYYGNSRRRQEKGTESIFKAILVENFLNLKGEMNIQVHKAQRTLNSFNSNRAAPKHIKLPKVKDKE